MPSTVHHASTYFVEYRGWSQEVDLHHYEFAEDPQKRFEAVGKATPLDERKELRRFGALPRDAVAAFQAALDDDKWQDHYRGVMSQLEELRRQIDQLKAQPPASVAAPDSASSERAAL